jgi:hypothetical protein
VQGLVLWPTTYTYKDAINYLPREDMKKSVIRLPLYSSPNNIRMITLRWTGHVAHRREIINELIIFVVKNSMKGFGLDSSGSDYGLWASFVKRRGTSSVAEQVSPSQD